jgi:hypothetical protein
MPDSALDEPAPPPGTGGAVVGVGAASDFAEHLATALERPVATVSRLSDAGRAIKAASRHSSTFILLPRRLLTYAAARELIEISCELDHPIGLLPLDAGINEMADGIARRWIPPSAPPVFPHRIALYCDFRTIAPPGFPLFAGADHSERFIQWLREGTEGVVMHVHGNGADFRVGRHVLCRQVGADRPVRGRADESHLPCQAGGRCRLEHKTSFDAFHGPSAVRARLLVLLSCAAFHPADGLLDARFVFAEALLSGDHVRGVVTSSMINFGTAELAVATAASLDAGATLGTIASRINALAGHGPPSYFCLGDPELRLTGQPVITPAAAAAALAKPNQLVQHPGTPSVLLGAQPPSPGPNWAPARLWQSQIVRSAIKAGDYPQAPGIALADSLVGASPGEASSPDGAGTGDNHDVDRLLCEFFAAILSERGPDVYSYLHSEVSFAPQIEVSERHDCGCRMVRSPLYPRWPGGAERWLYICERCGTIADCVAGLPAPRVTVSPGQASVTLPHGGNGGWHVSSLAPVGGWREQPSLVTSIEPHPETQIITLPLPPNPGPGLRRWALAVVREGDYTIVQRPVQQTEVGQPCS